MYVLFSINNFITVSHVHSEPLLKILLKPTPAKTQPKHMMAKSVWSSTHYLTLRCWLKDYEPDLLSLKLQTLLLFGLEIRYTIWLWYSALPRKWWPATWNKSIWTEPGQEAGRQQLCVVTHCAHTWNGMHYLQLWRPKEAGCWMEKGKSHRTEERSIK